MRKHRKKGGEEGEREEVNKKKEKKGKFLSQEGKANDMLFML